MYKKKACLLLLLAIAADVWLYRSWSKKKTPGTYNIWREKKPSYRIIMENERDKMEIFDRQFHYSIWHKSYYYIYSHCSTYTHPLVCIWLYRYILLFYIKWYRNHSSYFHANKYTHTNNNTDINIFMFHESIKNL